MTVRAHLRSKTKLRRLASSCHNLQALHATQKFRNSPICPRQIVRNQSRSDRRLSECNRGEILSTSPVILDRLHKRNLASRTYSDCSSVSEPQIFVAPRQALHDRRGKEFSSPHEGWFESIRMRAQEDCASKQLLRSQSPKFAARITANVRYRFTSSAFSCLRRSVSRTRGFCRVLDLPSREVCCGKGNHETCSCAGRAEW